jgi:uncharacterized membrane protein
MLTFIGILLLIFALVMVFVYPMLRKEDGKDRYGDKISAAPKILLMWNTRMRMMVSLIGFLFIVLGQSIMFAKEGHQYYVLDQFFGRRYAITTPGLKMIMPLSRVQEWSKYMEVKAVPINQSGLITEDISGIEGVIPGGVKVMFIDRATAEVYISARFEIPNEEGAFIKLVETYKTPENLVNNTLLPTINEQLTNVSFMYSADDYVSGAATDYKMTIEDALKNGGFVVKKVEVRDTLFVEESFIVDSLVSKKPRQIREIRTFVKNEKIFENGVPKRNPHEINVNKVITAQVIVSDVRLEEQFTKKLTQQRDISAEKIIEIQKIETARAAQQRIVAEGERDKAAERVEQEKAQVAKLISIETQVKEEESKRQLAEIAVKTAELNSKAVKINSDAEAYANRNLVSAGLTPQERAEWDYKTAIGVAMELKDLKLPQTYISGSGGNNGSNLLEQLIGAEMAKSMLNKK